VEITLKPRPSVVSTFVGREDILEAMRQTHFGDRAPGSDTPAISVLTGLGGSGKTQIALKFALYFEERHVLVYALAVTEADPMQVSRCPSLFHQCRIG
jgi:signal recognition particle GTPase